MNQDEEVPTRVTRGALRRRSVDREATPQKSTGAASSGTPKKSASTTKKVNSLNAIQESEGRPSTPIVGRNTRRRMSETIDTPTSLPNKLVQNLKEAESSAETGRRSRNSSLTEENINELNAAYEGGSGMMPARSRTPARLRASHETLASTSSPQTFPAVRRSTRRNSVTSDDGSVQSIPVTIPKVSSSLRTVKDDPIIEEDASDDRAESVSSEASSRTTRRKSTAVGKSPSPRSSAMSPDKSMGNESTPPRTIKTPRVALSSLTKGSPRSKNVSFSEDSKLDDNGASFCKTPTTVPKAVVVMVEDIRNSELKAAKGIDEFSVRKQEEQERLEEETEKLQMSQLRSPLTARSPNAKLEWEDELTDNEKDDQVEDEEEAQEKNEFIDDEVVEMEGYESGDSLASDLKREMEENEIPDQGEDLGSEDTEENDEQEEDEDEDGNDSWIVSSGEEGEQLDEDDLLQDTDDEDLKTSGPSLVINKETKKTPKRRRIIEVDDDSDQENIEEIAKSPKKNSSFIKRAATPSTSSQEKAEKEETQQDGSSQNDDALETSASETNASVVEDKKAADEGPANSTSAEVTQNQLASEIAPKPDRKSMPAVSLISAQFYIGGSKKRATIGGADMKMLTSTPKPTSLEVAKDKPKKSAIAKKANAANSGSSVVPNPFALGNGAKVVKSRLSLDSGATAQAVGQQKAKKSRLSLPTKFIEEDLPTETTDAVVGNGQAEEPVEPMEVDEEPEQGDGKEATKPNAAAGEKNDEVVVVQADTNKPKVAKPKPKALEDYDLANILSRCNEIVREDKERKKELASILRKKKEEKKRLRELEKQQELEAAKSAAEGTPPADTEDGLNSSATGNDDSAINQGGEGLKKKKKRKPKVKNYLLEELAETKKERLEQALRHKLEIIERRKQRKKERQLDQKKQVDKENGNDGVAPVNGGSGGIGAKLEKMKKKQKAKANDEISKQQLLQGPPVRIALSAFAVFNQLHNNQPQVAGALQQHEKQVPEMQPKKAQLAPPAVEKKQNKISPKKEEISEPTAKPEKVPHDVEEKENKATIPSETEQSKKKQKGKAAEDNATVETTPAKENETLSKKKAIPAVKAQSESALEEGGKDNVPYVAKSVSEGTLKEADKKSKKQKRKLAALELVTEQQMESDVNGSLEEAPPKFVSEKQKDKKRKQLTVDTMSSDIAVPETISKQKKLKKLVAKNEDAENRDVTLEGKKTAGAMDKIFTEGGEVKEKKMKKKKAKNQSAAQAENGSQQDRNAAELSRKKLGSLEQQDTAETPAITKTKKRKRDQGDESPTTVLAATPRPAKHTKLRVLQRIESGGFFEETVTPDRIRMKRNFGFQERQATPAKQLGFRVSSILPTDQNELRAVASSTKTHSKDERKKAKNGGGAVLPEPNRSLPLPVWTSGGMFLESEADDGNVGNEKKMTQKQKRGSNAKTDMMGGYIQLNVQGKADFRLKTLRPETTIEKPHRVDASTTDQSILNFKRKQLLEKTAHLRVKKKSHRM
uniref:Uncharacterized protein n=1 Tax=Anopheles epiroticus TaxID=199890 RepID=A0A182P3F7_9DIPT